MKKAFLCLLFLVLLAGILTGCCRHEFAPADCEHPETCQKCGEIQGEALGHDWLDPTCEAAQTCTRCGKTQGNPLGHDWMDATCDTPQTCTRCAATQGEALGHDFGAWTFTDTTMTHTCHRCGLEDIQELDRSVQLGSYLAGHWDFDVMYLDDQYISSYSFASPPFLLDFQEDGSFSGILDLEDATGTWEYKKYQEQEEYNYFVFDLHTSDDQTIGCLYYQMESPYIQLVYKNADVYAVPGSGIGEKLAGTAWSSDDSMGYSLVFHEDYTFTANLSGDIITGGWMTRPFRENGSGSLFCVPFMWFTQGGETISLSSLIYPETNNETDQNHFTPGQMIIYYNSRRITLEPTTQEDIAAQEQNKEETLRLLAGTWTSTSHAPWSSTATPTDVLGKYSVTFFEDGTFTASVGRDISGTWELDFQSEQGIGGKYYYFLYINEDRTYHKALLEHDIDGEFFDTLKFYPSISSAPNSPVHVLTLTRYPQDGLNILRQGKESLVGSFTSLSLDSYSEEMGENIRTQTTDYTMVFYEDGTFSGQLKIPVSGTWNIDFFREGDSGLTYRVTMAYDQENFHHFIYFQADDGFISVSTNGLEHNDFYQFLKDQTDNS